MAPRRGEPGSASERRFFITGWSPGGSAAGLRDGGGLGTLLAGEAEHALRVLRLRVGDRFIGLDGRGGEWPARVSAIDRNAVKIELDGEGRVDPPAGDQGSALPWIEIALAWPKPGRVEDMIDRLTQLGVSAVAQLACERGGPQSAQSDVPRRERCERVLREACKQSGRTWLPILREGPSPSPADTLILEPESTTRLGDWIVENAEHAATGRWTQAHPLSVLVGPEGGFTAAERESWLASGAHPVRLGPNVLRIETAAEAAMAILADRFFTPLRT